MTLLLMSAGLALYPLIPVDLVTSLHPNTGEPCLLRRAQDTTLPGIVTWGAEGLRAVPSALRYGLLALLVVALLLSVLPVARRASVSAHAWPQAVVLSLFAVLVGVFCWFFPVVPDRNAAFGDGSHLFRHIQRGSVFGAEVLAMHLLHAGYKAFGDAATAARATQLVGALSATAFAAGASFVAYRINRSVLVALGLVLSGTMVQFLGYAETTFAAQIFAMLFIASLFTDDEQPSDRRLFWMMTFAGLAIVSHTGQIVLVPACFLMLLSYAWRSRPEGWRVVLARLWLGLFAFGIVLMVGLVLPYFLRGQFGNVDGGADRIRFVPMVATACESMWVHYGMFSKEHALDLASGCLIGCPVALVLLGVSAVFHRSYRVQLDSVSRRALLLSLLVAASSASIPLVWNFDFGGWGDWNLLATYLFPLHFLGWAYWALVARKLPNARVMWLRVAVPALLVQSLAVLGIALQFY